MGSRGTTTLLRATGVWTLATGLTVTGLAWLAGELAGLRSTVVAGRTDAGFDQLVVWTAAVAAAAAVCWLWLVTTAVVVTALRGRPARTVRGCPDWLRRLVLAGCGLAIVGGVTGPTLAADPSPDPPALSGLALPDRASVDRRQVQPQDQRRDQPHLPRDRAGTRGQEDPRRAGVPSPRDTETVRVRPGDSLWRIAESLLPDQAPDREVARLATVLHRANRDVIGADPDLILPDQRLRVPDDPTRGSR